MIIKFYKISLLFLIVFVFSCNDADVSEDGLSVARQLIIFVLDNPTGNWDLNGNGTGKDDVDSACASASNLPENSIAAYGLASFDADNELRDLPSVNNFDASLPVNGSNGLLIANSYNDFIDGNGVILSNSIEDATGIGFFWASGSQADGSVSANNCSGYSTTAGNTEAGDTRDTDANRLNDTPQACTSLVVRLCIAPAR